MRKRKICDIVEKKIICDRTFATQKKTNSFTAGWLYAAVDAE